MGLFSGPKRKVCPQHGTYNSRTCNDGCRSQIAGATGQRVEDEPQDEAVTDPSNGWW